MRKTVLAAFAAATVIWTAPVHAGLVTAKGEVLVDSTLPGRGHGLCLAPDGKQAVVMALRPGRFAAVLDLENHNVRHRMVSSPGRHFYGHGVFSADGATLYTTENDFENGIGCIGLYDATNNFRRLGEWPSYGIEPHEIVLTADGGHLAVANGGILTHPDSGRAKLNLDTMVSSVALIDAKDGSLLAFVSPPPELHQLSLRHLAVDANNRMAIAIQYQGTPDDVVPLLATWDSRGELTFMDDSEPVLPAMRNYAGSVAMDHGGAVIAMTSAPGYLVTFWRADDLSMIAHRQIPDVCGVAAAGEPGGFLLSSGTGSLFSYDTTNGTLTARAGPPRMWDNHMMVFGS